MERHKPLLDKIREKYGKRIEEEIKSRAEEVKNNLFLEPELKEYSREEKEKFVRVRTKKLLNMLIATLRSTSDLQMESVIRTYLPRKEEVDYYNLMLGGAKDFLSGPKYKKL